ncbi:MAG TPA: hypothetical protein VKR06_37395 [Ktedonosporobacter sp.]|nr:hypothetical protein [Ktedonosporobacter sp.]
MSTNPSQGQNPDQSNQYGGYTGYTPPSPKDDPYGAFSQPQSGTSGTQSSDANYQYGQYGQTQQQYTSGQQQQQQYQPAFSSSIGGASAVATAAERKDAALSYVLGFLTGLFFFFKDRKSSFVRFHAAQSIAFSVPVFVIYLILRLLTGVGFINLLLGPIIGFLTTVVLIGGLLIWAFLIFQSYRGGKFRLPYFAEYADRIVARFTKK